jgi:hypothetical protein
MVPNVVTGPTTLSGGIIGRVIKLPTGGGRIEIWKVGEGWIAAPSEIKLHEFMPGAGLPVSAFDAARAGMPAL